MIFVRNDEISLGVWLVRRCLVVGIYVNLIVSWCERVHAQIDSVWTNENDNVTVDDY